MNARWVPAPAKIRITATGEPNSVSMSHRLSAKAHRKHQQRACPLYVRHGRDRKWCQKCPELITGFRHPAVHSSHCQGTAASHFT